ncbi:hypothetical protein NN6n1_18720 [Shinella zoogloeoides]
MTSSHLDFDCDFRRAASHEVVQIDQIVRQAMLKIYGRPEGERSFIQSPFFAEIAVVGSEIIGVAAFLDEALTCLYVVERFRNSGVGTCLLHNAMLSGVRAATIPFGNFRALTFFELRGWLSHGKTVLDIGGEELRGIAMHYGNRN